MNELEDERAISGKKFAALRRRLVMSQEELAPAIEMSTSNVRRVEQSDVTTIRAKSIRALARLAGVEADLLLVMLSPYSPASDDAKWDRDRAKAALAEIFNQIRMVARQTDRSLRDVTNNVFWQLDKMITRVEGEAPLSKPEDLERENQRLMAGKDRDGLPIVKAGNMPGKTRRRAAKKRPKSDQH